MSKDTEKMFRALDKFMEQFEELTEEQAEEKIREFVSQWNDNLSAGGPIEKDQWYYLDLAMDAENEKVARKNAQKALSIDPYCTDAEYFLIELMNITEEERKKRLEKLIEKTETHLKDEGYFGEEDTGNFYGIHETRPYMRLLYSYVEILIGMGKFTMAINVGEKIINLNENDNMGTRYDLMALYAFQENLTAAESLYKVYNEDSISMLFPLILLYYKLDDYTKARRYLKLALKKTPDFKRFLQNDIPDKEVEKATLPNGFLANSIGEVMDVIERNMFLIESSVGGMVWMTSEVGKK